MPLFQRGEFSLAGGDLSDWKIECDALSKEDWETAAYLLAQRLPRFGSVVGVPRGGLALARAMEQYISTDGVFVALVVDDVWTTGKSWRKFVDIHMPVGLMVYGAVLFARNPTPENVVPLFSLHGGEDGR